jgi:hypothetical protein
MLDFLFPTSSDDLETMLSSIRNDLRSRSLVDTGKRCRPWLLRANKLPSTPGTIPPAFSPTRNVDDTSGGPVLTRQRGLPPGLLNASV